MEAHILQVQQGREVHLGTKALLEEESYMLKGPGHMMVNSLHGWAVAAAADLEAARTVYSGEVPGETKTRQVDCHRSMTASVTKAEVRAAVPQEQTGVMQRQGIREQPAYLLKRQRS